MAYFGTEAFFEGEASQVKISSKDISCELSDEFDKDHLPLIEFLQSIEKKYKDILEVKSKPDIQFVNDLFSEVYNQFHKEFTGDILFDEITQFFELDYYKFFGLLSIPYKRFLMKSLRAKVNIDTFIRQRRIEQAKQGGAYQPTFKKH